MKRLWFILSIIFLAVFSLYFYSCGSSGGGGTTTTGIAVVGSLSGTTGSVSAHRQAVPSLTKSLGFKATHDSNPTCPEEQQYSVTVDPLSYIVKLKRVTLLGSSDTGTADYDIMNVSSVDDAVEVDFVTNSTFTSSTTYPTAGTYDGIEIELYYVGMTIPMVVPALNALESESTFYSANRTIRGYFTTVGDVVKRDVTLLVDENGTEVEYWIDRDSLSATPYDLFAVSSGNRPTNVLDLWADDAFWNRDPVTICTRTTDMCDFTVMEGSGFTFTMSDGSTSVTIPENPSGLYELAFTFDVSQRFTFWEDTNYSDATTESFGTYRVGYDCGLRIFFPDVTISLSNE